MTVDIRIGDCRTLLAAMGAQSVNCCVTSPPYFGLRDYGVDGPRYKQLGNSWAVPKFCWLGERIQRLMPAANDNQEQCIANAA